jgi:hypothetical protein
MAKRPFSATSPSLIATATATTEFVAIFLVRMSEMGVEDESRDQGSSLIYDLIPRKFKSAVGPR